MTNVEKNVLRSVCIDKWKSSNFCDAKYVKIKISAAEIIDVIAAPLKPHKGITKIFPIKLKMTATALKYISFICLFKTTNTNPKSVFTKELLGNGLWKFVHQLKRYVMNAVLLEDMVLFVLFVKKTQGINSVKGKSC